MKTKRFVVKITPSVNNFPKKEFDVHAEDAKSAIDVGREMYAFETGLKPNSLPRLQFVYSESKYDIMEN